jgi:predicted adenylyl cyclase CyaB
MSQNIEWKGKLTDWAAANQIAAQWATTGPEQQLQRDTYFAVRTGRLKLREITIANDTRAELIWYQRDNLSETKTSNYEVLPVTDPQRWRHTMAAALGQLVVVTKQRTIWWHHQVRMHLDQVAELGQFLEFEAVMQLSDDPVVATALVQRLIAEFGLSAQAGIAESYSDLLIAKQST